VTLRYLLDTNILAEPLRPKPDNLILDRLKRHEEEIAIASVTWHEMWFGCYRLPVSARRTAIEAYLTQVVAPGIPILSYHQEAADWHARERARLAAVGRTPPFADGMVAAVAWTNALTLITLNVDDFQAFDQLQCATWLEERRP